VLAKHPERNDSQSRGQSCINIETVHFRLSSSRGVLQDLIRSQPATIGEMGFALWLDQPAGLAWAQGTHEYRPMGTAVIASTDQFRRHDFRQGRRRPQHLRK